MQSAAPEAAGTTGSVSSEFFVDMHCGGCAKSVRSALGGVPGVEIVDISVDRQTVVTRGAYLSITFLKIFPRQSRPPLSS